MYHKVESVMITCDGCKRPFEDCYNSYTIFVDESHADDRADRNEWHCTVDDKHYCPSCYDIDNEFNLILKTKQT